MKRKHAYNKTARQVEREILPVKRSLSSCLKTQIEKIQIEQTIFFSKRQYTIYEAIPCIIETYR